MRMWSGVWKALVLSLELSGRGHEEEGWETLVLSLEFPGRGHEDGGGGRPWC